MIQEIKDEDNESDGNENMHDPYDICSPRTREKYDEWNEEQHQAFLKEKNQPEPENWKRHNGYLKKKYLYIVRENE